jgi:type II secretory ATPase GspE/PulE/Tfp pilus assembly ATPase PilB-like protein
MNAISDRFDQSMAAQSIATAWGWKSPSEEVLALADKSSAAQGKLVGQILVDWGVIDLATRDRLLATKPDGAKTLDYFAEKESVKVSPVVEQVLALQNNYPFYEGLHWLTPHEAMEDPAVFKKSETLDAAFMLIEGEAAVLVFHEYAALVRYSTNGRTARNEDPIVAANNGRRPLLAVGSREDISSIIKHFSRSTGADDEQGGQSASVWRVKSDDSTRTPEERELSRLFDHAMAEGASDVAFVPQDNGSVEVYIRKFGILIPAFRNPAEGKSAKKTVIPAAIASRAINFLQSRSGANPGHSWLREPGDGNLRYKSSSADASMRVSIIPLNHLNDFRQTRSVSVRLFSRSETEGDNAIDLLALGVPEDVLMHLRDAVAMPQGVILISGPLNQGKSTTAAGMIHLHELLFGFTKKRIGLEDPIERKIPGMTQFNAPQWIKDVAKRFNVMLKGFKRHDFNLMFMGEIRDAEGADYSVRFASSGHLFLTTLHARDSILAFDIFQEMVKDDLKFQSIESMSLSVSQRLVPTVCKHCGIPHSTPTKEEQRLFTMNLASLGEQFEMPETFTRQNPDGCEHCMFGIDGSVPVIELLPFTRAVKDAAHAMRRGDSARSREIIANARTTTLLGEGLRYVRAGKVDLRSVLFL